ncbi:putative NAD dependent epimerase/dehydratase [Mollisia scopiformis]|uniref:Putative NAD dependent epimerase/dehydratase n=1 Tax=Mollisia scopiformis TaxID=149040 RepID=A0A194WZU2_MOLSC|nr:putative NAD dependent epimerase/dehydratase [Mollisia scopiformis]KUJ13142.1 putative NAD dependent epimerase/dehydratase [Mollisia scopiformis]
MASESQALLVLVTGGSGFIGSYCIIALLNAGYRVRATIRSLSKSSAVKESLKHGSLTDSSLESLSFVSADLSSDEGWDQAVVGCSYVLHVASPFPPQLPKHEDDLIIPARDGTLRVLKAAKSAGVKRVVLTSSFAAIGYGHPSRTTPFTEESWTDITKSNVTPYEKSKTIAERAAWDFVSSPEGQGLQLSVVNPVAVLGPVLSNDFSPSILLVQRLLKGDLPGCPDIMFGIVDVRDVASLHLLAMTSPAAAGERFLAIAPSAMTVQEVAITLKQRLPELSKKTRTRTLPDFLVRLVALFDPEVASIAAHLGKKKYPTNEKAKRVLGWEPRSREDAITATAESLVKLGLVKK